MALINKTYSEMVERVTVQVTKTNIKPTIQMPPNMAGSTDCIEGFSFLLSGSDIQSANLNKL